MINEFKEEDMYTIKINLLMLLRDMHKFKMRISLNTSTSRYLSILYTKDLLVGWDLSV